MKKLDKSEIKVWISRNVRNDLYAWVELFDIKLLFYLD